MLIRTLSVAALASLAVAQSPLTQPRAVEDLLPESTYAAMRFGGLEACKQATGQMPLTTLIETFLADLPAEHREELLEEGLDDVADELRHELKQVGMRPADLRALLRQPMAIALGRLSIEGMGPSMALLIEEGNHKQAITRSLRSLLGVIARSGVDVTMEKAEVAGLPMYRVRIEDGPPLFAGSIGGSYCVSNSRGYLREIARVADGKQPGLTKASRVGLLRQQLPSQPLLSWVANMQSVMDAFAPHLPYEAEDISEALGLGRLDLIYAATTAHADGGSDLLHIGIGGSEKGLMKALMAQPVDLSMADLCSANTVVFGAGSLDVPAVIDAFQRVLKLLPEEAQREMKREMGREMAREFRRSGTSPQEVHAMLRAFGDQVGFAVSLAEGPVPMPELTVRLAVRDREAVEALMLRVEAMAEQEGEVEWRSRKVDGHVVRFFNAPELEGVPVSPCYVITDDGLWMGSQVTSMVRTLRRGNKPDTSLSAQEDFAALRQRAAGASGVLHVRTFRGIELGWRSIETMLYPMVDANSEELGFDSEALPDQEELAAALGTTTMLYTVDDDGVTVKSEGLFALGSLLAAFGTLGHEVLDRMVGRVF